MSILQLFLKCLNHGITQFLGWHLRLDLRVIVLRIVVAPLVVFVSADLSGPVLLGDRSPGIDQLRDVGSILSLFWIEAEKDFSISVSMAAIRSSKSKH
jgi:hypothetical protein